MPSIRPFALPRVTEVEEEDALILDRADGTPRSILASDLITSVDPYANSAEGIAGIATDKKMSPASTKAAIDAAKAFTVNSGHIAKLNDVFVPGGSPNTPLYTRLFRSIDLVDDFGMVPNTTGDLAVATANWEKYLYAIGYSATSGLPVRCRQSGLVFDMIAGTNYPSKCIIDHANVKLRLANGQNATFISCNNSSNAPGLAAVSLPPVKDVKIYGLHLDLNAQNQTANYNGMTTWRVENFLAENITFEDPGSSSWNFNNAELYNPDGSDGLPGFYGPRLSHGVKIDGIRTIRSAANIAFINASTIGGLNGAGDQMVFVGISDFKLNDPKPYLSYQNGLAVGFCDGTVSGARIRECGRAFYLESPDGLNIIDPHITGHAFLRDTTTAAFLTAADTYGIWFADGGQTYNTLDRFAGCRDVSVIGANIHDVTRTGTGNYRAIFVSGPNGASKGTDGPIITGSRVSRIVGAGGANTALTVAGQVNGLVFNGNSIRNVDTGVELSKSYTTGTNGAANDLKNSSFTGNTFASTGYSLFNGSGGAGTRENNTWSGNSETGSVAQLSGINYDLVGEV